MKERPILFSAPMVRAILDNRKTMTRRVVNPQPERCEHPGETPRLRWCPKCSKYNAQLDCWIPSFVWNANLGPEKTGASSITDYCPYGKPGDRLWVRETWCCTWPFDGKHCEDGPCYKATDEGECGAYLTGQKWRPSIFMPRNLSRLTIEVTDVRVERLQQITEHDAEHEGVGRYNESIAFTCMGAFSDLWDVLNKKRGFSWESNPFVWVVSFKRI